VAFTFDPEEPVRTEILRVACEQLDNALHELRERINDDPVGAVHDARKAIKKERSLLRLVRGLPPAQRRQENSALREAAQGLAGMRDAEVVVATLDRLSEHFAGQLPAGMFAGIREQLTSERAMEVDNKPRAIEELAAIRSRVSEWRLTGGGWDALEGGLARSYKRGRKAFRLARATGSLEDLHEWRKRVKDLWYQQRLLGPICGPAVTGQAEEAHHLSELLGEDHDLGMLAGKLTDDLPADAVDVEGIVRLVERRRGELQAQARAIGARLYAERPSAFRRRMRRSWKAGRALAVGHHASVTDRPGR
jgi:CHAD domain-containing protein